MSRQSKKLARQPEKNILTRVPHVTFILLSNRADLPYSGFTIKTTLI